MARKADTKRKKPAAAAKPAKPAEGKARGKGSGAGGSDVERRWKEYWSSRKLLEEAVDKVKIAREALQKAQELERTRRAEFDQIKRSLTTLLDVEPAGSSQPKPVQMPTGLPSPSSPPSAPKQAG